ncbi:RIP metalloprotease RseP [Vibrio sp. UCD-FRSSP16_10]|uniref:sigma E protease regulator RseP n=1 Tax=unclassified Vibrio TaxID=2614977 RepID=UPI0007FFF998|nr:MULTISPECIES: sigma E protease regulator RseP [unclassified Vibrio]OBT16882.1 RIP metalloprotease RseP [Vibrio sp. UCD-FRSSP16_30]OBT21870.1 RIP metalloprotease RseP [Vibrio sp. UCD-FRSSP16_10]
MTSILWNFASFVVALGILVAVHEYGHFWVARRCGVKVHKFSIGFGKSIWKKIGKTGTEYSISVIPLGGYVKMLDSRVDDVAEHEKNLAFDNKKLWQRSAIVAAGPMANFIFAIVAYWLVFLIGVPAVKPVIGEVTPNSIVAQAGIQPGMELKSIDGVKTADWESVNMGLIARIGDDHMQVTVASDNEIGQQQTLNLNLDGWNFDPETESAMTTLGFRPYSPEIYLTLAHVQEGGAAQKAGLLIGDTILAVNDNSVSKWQDFASIIRHNPDHPLKLDIERNGVTLPITLTPGVRKAGDGNIGFAGVSPKVGTWPDDYRFDLRFGPLESIGRAIDKTKQVTSLTLSMLKKLVVGDVGLNNLSGPISIAKGAGATADYGFVYFLGFLALISINLGIINLMPLPILDGGHLLFFAIEAVTRRPVPEKIQEMGYRVGGAVVFALMSIAILNDFMRL